LTVAAERRRLIDDALRERLNLYLAGIAREQGMPALAVGGSADHTHILISLPGTISVSKAVQMLKASSSKWVHEHFPNQIHFSWQEGYGAFSIGISQKQATVNYIQKQAEHHKKYSFSDEMKKFLTIHEMDSNLD
jgi:REP element-mobilizing transposase RayT